MQRYKEKGQVNIGDVIIFDNLIGFKEELPKSYLKGKVVNVDNEGDNIGILVNTPQNKEGIEVEIPFYLCQ